MNYRLSLLPVLCFMVFSSTVFAEAEGIFTLSTGDAEIEKEVFGGTDTSFKIGSGFRVTDSSGIEIYWANYGEPEKTVNVPTLGNVETSTELYTLAFQYVHFFPVADSIDVLARFGLGFWKSEISVPGAGKFNDDGLGLSGGAGVEARLIENWALRVEWEYSALNNFEVNFLSAGFAHYFE